jgi:hypothetical protein
MEAVIARQRRGKNVSAATNAGAVMEVAGSIPDELIEFFN